jgi:Fe2+ transport system protein FeoA
MGVRRVSVLSQLHVGESGVLVALDLPESVQNHLMHMGFVPEALVTALRRAPAGDPTVYGVDGMEIALRHETAEAIRVRPAEIKDSATLDTALDLPVQNLVEAAR